MRFDITNKTLRFPELVLVVLVTYFTGCGPIEHNEEKAIKSALDFAEIVLIKQDFDRGYEQMSGKAKAYIPLNIFKDAMLKLHPDGYPKTIKPTGYRPYAEYDRVEVSRTGDNAGKSFDYVLTLLGTAKTEYNVTIVNRLGFASSMGGLE